MNRIKVMTILGTRPEIIRLSMVMKKLDEFTDHVMVHTNQNYDFELNQVFFDDLELRKPDHVLSVKGKSIGDLIGNILSQTEDVLKAEQPDAVLILGDTNSALACIVAKRMKIPVFHMEAGNRCFDDRVPEEINRRIVDHTSDVNLCYTEHARRNLLREGLPSQNIFVTGSPLLEVYEEYMDMIDASDVLTRMVLEEKKYIVASIHREENVDNPENFKAIMEALNELVDIYDMPIIFSTHPRTRNRLEELDFKLNKKIQFMKPFGMLDYIQLQKNALCNLSDSGTIHEDSAILGIAAVNVRESNERPEAYDTGNTIMTGMDKDTIVHSVDTVIKQQEQGINFKSPYDYEDEICSDKVVRHIIGLSKIIRKKKYYL